MQITPEAAATWAILSVIFGPSALVYAY